ncbi:DNA gyrase subunit A [candidate division WOR-1 bacterium RIFCSPLOWO2_02_FULL_46_20]|uniref:DNA gyrase subunit A n=1 Tax=candidate division WOR-1 bacterium RIFCSPLOWO2_02_FULL_46_20 TaxID=1802567 RepID=A0A1F4RFN4_UNCSA|nr:MAG: DNA gyrase subunit A [candidate division WOR-1 bacterium RIFCSPHIGHO2_02_FULL_45_12]OGC06999.1 MAG: DNA gyrase subunit A [candidate division WOR-1 bacterium RIFCSPLOWO2_02_FULL_46_20]
MKTSYIDYSMSVIVGRALPDVRDGLKPVHRRILFAMEELGLQPGKPYKKSARIVGEVLGKYHPHGDSAVYESMVRMAQDFSLRYMLVDGQGNFGSVDGDSAAAMRYTEVRLHKHAVEMLADIEKDTVDFGPNFDESLEEPLVLPARIPNLLINGSSGIAVGMATNIPPHNLEEVIAGTSALIDNPEITIAELSKIIKAPDFPTGAYICGKAGVKQSYETGRGIITLRAKAETEEVRGGKQALIISELPYQVNKATLIENIAEQVKDKKIKGISDLRDESDRDGMRIYIEIKRDSNADIVLNQLYKHTELQTTFGINMVALVNGIPRLLNLKQILEQYVKHREEVVTRRAKFDLRKAEEQAHILEGLLIALQDIDGVIKLIKKSKSVDEARSGLMKKYKLSQIQAQAILDMRLQKLTQLETTKLEDEFKALKKLIGELKDILGSKKKILKVVKAELEEIGQKFKGGRETKIAGEAEEIEEEALIEEAEVVILITRDGYVKRLPISAFRAQKRGGKGVAGMATRGEDEIDKLFTCSTLSHILFFTNKGKVYKVKAYELPETSRAGKGQSIANFLELTMGEVVTEAVTTKDFNKDWSLAMSTRNGMIKKVSLEDFANIRRTGIIAIKLKDKDELRWVRLVNGKQELVMCTARGLLIRFAEKLVRPMGRAASGVRGIRLGKDDKVVTMEVVAADQDLLAVSADGYGKRMPIKDFGAQSRGGKGHIAMKLRPDDEVAKMIFIHKDDELLFVTGKGTMMRQEARGISTQGRYAKGVRLVKLDAGDYIVDLARVVKAEEELQIEEEK